MLTNMNETTALAYRTTYAVPLQTTCHGSTLNLTLNVVSLWPCQETMRVRSHPTQGGMQIAIGLALKRHHLKHYSLFSTKAD
jgi:hypothetical protein